MYAASNQEEFTALRTLLRSLGQIVLQSNALTGACLIAAWLVWRRRGECRRRAGRP
jgi:urea transporter